MSLEPPPKPALIERTTPKGTVPHRGRFRCHCGAEFETTLQAVSSGHTKSCGCWHRQLLGQRNSEQRRVQHGHAARGPKPSPTWQSWRGMRKRCLDEKARDYPRYGGRGITVCDRWKNSFEAFLEDMGERPEGMTLDRIDGLRGYEPANCRWATIAVQAANKVKA